MAPFVFHALILTAALATYPDDASGSKKEPATNMIIGMRSGETHLDGRNRRAPGEVDRRLTFEVASLAVRYHLIETLDDAVHTENAQHLQALKARLRLEGRGRASLHAGVFPGSRFTSGWNNTGWGTGEPGLRLYLKQLYLEAQPARGVEMQWGGLAVAYGESTEVTSYDYDGYLTGERVRLSQPKRLFFDEISLSLGYLSGGDAPGFFDRLHRLGDVNYGHVLVLKSLGQRARISADYTRHSGMDTFRQAAHLETPGWVIVDALRFENYQRAGADAGYGFNVYGQKRLHPKLSVGAGYARIDRSFLNSDRFPAGESLYQNSHFTINSELSVMVAFTRALWTSEATSPRTRLDVALGVNLVPRLGAGGAR